MMSDLCHVPRYITEHPASWLMILYLAEYQGTDEWPVSQLHLERKCVDARKQAAVVGSFWKYMDLPTDLNQAQTSRNVFTTIQLIGFSSVLEWKRRGFTKR